MPPRSSDLLQRHKLTHQSPHDAIQDDNTDYGESSGVDDSSQVSSNTISVDQAVQRQHNPDMTHQTYLNLTPQMNLAGAMFIKTKPKSFIDEEDV